MSKSIEEVRLEVLGQAVHLIAMNKPLDTILNSPERDVLKIAGLFLRFVEGGENGRT